MTIAPGLTVLTAYFNPAGFQSRKRNYDLFAARMRATPGVQLLTVECAFGGRPFDLEPDPSTLQVRAEHALWIKENLLNLGLARVQTPYVAWVDGDILFQNPDWVAGTIDALHTATIVQPWSAIYGLDAAGQKMDEGVPSFCRVHRNGYAGRCQAGCCHTGYAWAARRDLFERTGGLLEEMIVGAADHLMAVALFDGDRSLWEGAIRTPYPPGLDAWCRKFSAATARNIGYVEGDIHHLFHGAMSDRHYGRRHFIPTQHGYDPTRHLRKNAHGVLQIVDLPELCAHLGRYFAARREDS